MNRTLAAFRDVKPEPFKATWNSPANIAFVKYWGKKGHQIPANPSLSMTLKECTSTTQTHFSPSDSLSVKLHFQGKADDKFGAKILKYLSSLQEELPWISKLSLDIETSNTFPHGAGIASSASGLSAFALTLTDYLYQMNPSADETSFFEVASYLSRLASGSACRSVYGGFTTWGASSQHHSSDYFATPLTVHPELQHLHDTVLVVDSQEKIVSSRAGHERMAEHFFAKARFEQAEVHFTQTVAALKNGEIEVVGRILESEALSLHAMMLTSPEAYTLLRPQTLKAIEAIWDFRKATKLPLYFTLDAGPNLHLIYPESDKNKISTFIIHELTPLSERIIDDQTGEGPRKC